MGNIFSPNVQAFYTMTTLLYIMKVHLILKHGGKYLNVIFIPLIPLTAPRTVYAWHVIASKQIIKLDLLATEWE